MTGTESYYRRAAADLYDPTGHAQGAWSPEEQHIAPVAGLIAHAIDRHDPRPDLALAKLGYEILGFIPLRRTHVEVRTIRPGRTIEQLQAVASVEGREVVRATAWRLLRSDTSAVAGTHLPQLPDPESVPTLQGIAQWGGGFIESLEVRSAAPEEPGRGWAWLRTPLPLVADEHVGPTAGYVALVDTANGIATRVSPQHWVFPNVDLVVHLVARPEPGWVGLDTTVTFGSAGVGLTTTSLHDVTGPIGRAEQILTVRPAP